MYFLSFETSTKIFSLALNQDEKTLRFRNLKSALVLEDSIIPAVDKMLDTAKIKFSQIDGFAIALGPGSFTSLRVGLSTIKAFAMSTGKPVVGIPSMDIIACGLKGTVPQSSGGLSPSDYDEICVINDARRGKVYACIYAAKGTVPLNSRGQSPFTFRKSDYLLITLDEILEKVQGKTLFVGDALGIYRKDIEEAYQKYNSDKKSTCQCLFADEKYWNPQARAMATLAYEKFQNKQYDDAAKLLPLYLYPQDCQVTSPATMSSPNFLVGDPKRM